MKFHGIVEFLKGGYNNKLDIEFGEYGSEISGKVLTLYEAKSQPDILVKIIDSKTNKTINQAFTDNSGNFEFKNEKRVIYQSRYKGR